MHEIEEHYYTFNKGFLKLLGIWPHDKSRFVLLQQMFIMVITMTYIAMQVIVRLILAMHQDIVKITIILKIKQL